MKYLYLILLVFSSYWVCAETETLKGSISDFKVGTDPVKAGVAYYSIGGYTQVGSSTVDQFGNFNLSLEKKIPPSIVIIFFSTGDTFAFVGGIDKSILFKARWYENMVVSLNVILSEENRLLDSVKLEMKNIKQIEDSISSLGINISEFDPAYQAKTSALRESLQHVYMEYNQRLILLQTKYPQSYVSRSILPVVLRMVMLEDSIISKEYDTNRAFQHNNFFNKVGTDSWLITNPFLREKIQEFMDRWVSQKDKGLKEGVDMVIKRFGYNEYIKKYALASITDYFSERNNFPLIDYLYASYYNTCEAPPLQGKSADIIAQMKRLAKGNKAPELILPTPDGQYFWLSQMKTRKSVVLFFWASWCPHCREMMPELLKYYHDSQAKGIDFIAVSLDDSKNDWLSFISKNKLDWINVSDLKRWDSEAVRLYALRGTPTFYVLDASFNIVGRTNELIELKKLLNN